MGKLDQVNGNVPMALDKLSGIRGDLVRTDDTWESWDFVKLCEALRLWIRRNPVDSIPIEEERSFWLNITYVLIVDTAAIRLPDAGTNTRAVTVDDAITLPSATAIE